MLYGGICMSGMYYWLYKMLVNSSETWPLNDPSNFQSDIKKPIA